jgi:hypothetical protein
MSAVDLSADADAAMVLRSLVEVFRTGETSRVEALISRAYVDHQGVGSGTLVGPTGFCDAVRAARGSLGSLVVSVEDLFSDGDRAVARLRWRGTDAAGALVERETIDIVRVADGSAVEHWGAECWSRRTEAG